MENKELLIKFLEFFESSMIIMFRTAPRPDFSWDFIEYSGQNRICFRIMFDNKRIFYREAFVETLEDKSEMNLFCERILFEIFKAGIFKIEERYGK